MSRRQIVSTMVLLACVGPLSGCYNAAEINAFLLKPRRPVSGIEYRVLPPDVLGINSIHVPEINNQHQQIGPDGRINLPLLGEMKVAGLTQKEIEQMIADAARQYYRDVDVTVTISAYNSQKYFVFGQVSSPGPKIWTGHDTLLDALAGAQPTQLAWPERIVLVRGDQPQEGGREQPTSKPVTKEQKDAWKKYHETGVHVPDPDNPRHTIIINMMAMVDKGDMTNNVLLQPNDVIYVQPNPLAQIGLIFQMILFPVQPVTQTVATPRTAAAVTGL